MRGVHERLAELYMVGQKRPLTNEETLELNICMKANAEWIWKMNKLKTLSLLASQTNDMDWQHEICARIEKLIGIGPENGTI